MNKIKNTLALGTLLFSQPMIGFAVSTDRMPGVWGSATLQGDVKSWVADFDKAKWRAMNQTSIRKDSPQAFSI